jgi:hypothetical protein
LVIDPHAGRGFRVHSENRDAPAAKRLREQADKLDDVLASLTGEDAARELANSLRLDSARGPNRLPDPEPLPEAWRLAELLAQDSLGPLQDALRDLGGMTVVGTRWSVRPPRDELPPEATLGLPLLFASSDATVEAVTKMQVARQLDKFTQIRENLSLRLSELIVEEHRLWDLASAYGGPSPRIPYAFAFRAFEWFWAPRVHAGGVPTPTVCLRCGSLMVPRRVIASPPRCAACAKESPAARVWPAHALSPAERGTWWLRCQAKNCANAFVAHAQARRCADCRSSSTTPSQRRPLEPRNRT